MRRSAVAGRHGPVDVRTVAATAITGQGGTAALSERLDLWSLSFLLSIKYLECGEPRTAPSMW